MSVISDLLADAVPAAGDLARRSEPEEPAGHWRAPRHDGLLRARLPADEPLPLALRNHPAFDVAWPMTALLAMLFNLQIGSLSPLIMCGLLPLFLLFRYDSLPRLIAAGAPVLLLPLFALLSTAWSIDAEATLYYATLYLVTVLVGITIGGGFRRRETMIGIFGAFAVYALASFYFGRQVGWGGGDAGAFAGLSGGKNSSGDTAALGALASLAFMALAAQERRVSWVLLALAVLAAQTWILINAHSTGALIAGGAAAACATLWLVSQRFRVAARSTIFILVSSGALAAAATQRIWFAPLYDTVIDASGKDTTLTGRTFIWDRAWEVIDLHPGLGVGFAAFWNQGNLAAEGLWRYAGISSRSGFNFHNTPIEILVHLGFAGLILFAAVTIPLVVVLFMRTMTRPDCAAIFLCAFVTYEGLRLMFESFVLGPVQVTTTMFIATLAFSLRWRSAEPGATPARPALGR